MVIIVNYCAHWELQCSQKDFKKKQSPDLCSQYSSHKLGSDKDFNIFTFL